MGKYPSWSLANAAIARKIAFSLLAQLTPRARARSVPTIGVRIDTRMAMIPMTISISTRVNPWARREVDISALPNRLGSVWSVIQPKEPAQRRSADGHYTKCPSVGVKKYHTFGKQ